jgi:hypothetical protein
MFGAQGRKNKTLLGGDLIFKPHKIEVIKYSLQSNENSTNAMFWKLLHQKLRAEMF